jgi:ATP:cob(I)alamin adenosyltransferase
MDRTLSRIQNDLFDVGADLATPIRDAYEFEPLRVVEAQVSWLEQQIDQYNANLEPLRSFILPAGSVFSAHMHVARTTVRRAERDIAHLAAIEELNPNALKYMNRLSDLCFVLARFGNDNGKNDKLWVPGENR